MTSVLMTKNSTETLSLQGQVTSVYPRTKSLSLQDRLNEYRLARAKPAYIQKRDPSGEQGESGASQLALHVVRPFADPTFIGNVRLSQSTLKHKAQDGVNVGSTRNKEIHSIRSVILKRQKSAKVTTKLDHEDTMADDEINAHPTRTEVRDRVYGSDQDHEHNDRRHSSPSVDSQSHFLLDSNQENSASRSAIQKLNEKYKARVSSRESVHLPKPTKPTQIQRPCFTRVSSRKLGDINRVTAVSRCDAVEIVDNQIATIDGSPPGRGSVGERAQTHATTLLSRRKNQSRPIFGSDMESPGYAHIESGQHRYSGAEDGGDNVGLPVLDYRDLKRSSSLRISGAYSSHQSPRFSRNSRLRRSDPWNFHHTRNFNDRQNDTHMTPRAPPHSPTTPPADDLSVSMSTQTPQVSLIYTTVKSRMVTHSMPMIIDDQTPNHRPPMDFTRSLAQIQNEAGNTLNIDHTPCIALESPTNTDSQPQRRELESHDKNVPLHEATSCEGDVDDCVWQEEPQIMSDDELDADSYFPCTGLRENGTPTIPDLPPDSDSMVPLYELHEGSERDSSPVHPHYRPHSRERPQSKTADSVVDEVTWNPRGLRSSHIAVRQIHNTQQDQLGDMEEGNTPRKPLNTPTVVIQEPLNRTRDNRKGNHSKTKAAKRGTSKCDSLEKTSSPSHNDRTSLVDVKIYSGNNSIQRSKASSNKSLKADLADAAKYPSLMYDPSSYATYQHSKFRGKKSRARNSLADNSAMRYLRVSLGDESDLTKINED